MSGKQKLKGVFLGCPVYDGTSMTGQQQTYIHAMAGGKVGGSQRKTFTVGPVFSESSALCYNYNILWAQFMAAWTNKEVEYFAMLHSDLQVVGHPYWDDGLPWVEWMVDKMEELDVACLSVVNAIKSRQGHTSVAMGQGDWGQRRLSFEEIAKLPPTFTDAQFKEATGTTLLVNTGIMLIKPDSNWAYDFQFQFHDRIHKQPDGTWMPQMAPEDWNMSRFFHNHNIPYAATSEVKTLHHGRIAYPNWDDGSGLYQKD